MSEAVNAFFEAHRNAFDLQDQASHGAVAEIIIENDGVPESIEHFMLAVHGFGRVSYGHETAWQIKLQEYYDSLEKSFGLEQSGKFIALLAGSEMEREQQRILRIGRIATVPEYEVLPFPGPVSPLVFRLRTQAQGYPRGEVYVRVAQSVDVSEYDKPSHGAGNRIGDDNQVRYSVSHDEELGELWLLSHESVYVRSQDSLPSNETWQYRVGIKDILAARDFDEVDDLQLEGDAAYISVIAEALQRLRETEAQIV